LFIGKFTLNKQDDLDFRIFDSKFAVMKKSISVLISMFLLLSVWGQNTVRPVKKTSSTTGVYYSLPQTIIQVDLKVKKETFYAGPLASYADDFLGKDDVKTDDVTTYSIEEISLSTSAQPDPDQFFFVEFNPEGFKENRRFIMSLNEAGLLKGVNSATEEKSKKDVEKFFQLGEASSDKKDLFDYQAIQASQQVKDTTIRMITVDTTVKRDITINTRWVNKSKEEIAKQVAQRIQKIYQDRYYLSIGYQETAYDEGAIKYMDKNLLERQQEYIALFTGKTITSYKEYQFDWIPGADTQDIDQTTICKFSVHSGVRPANSSIGLPLTLQAESEQTTKQINNHAMQMRNSSKPRKGVHYRIPDFARVSLFFDGEEMIHQRMRINQFGVVSYAPWSDEINFQIHPESGALKNIELFYRD